MTTQSHKFLTLKFCLCLNCNKKFRLLFIFFMEKTHNK